MRFAPLLCCPWLLLAACGDSPIDAGVPDAATSATVLAPAGNTAVKMPVDGISCDVAENVVFHIHAHLAMFDRGDEKLVPAGVGIGPPLVLSQGEVTGGSCFCWLHSHDHSGIIHIESPVQRTYTLGNFFDIWGLPLSSTKVGPLQGPVTAWLNAQVFPGDPAAIPLDAHNVIQLDVGTATPPRPYTFPSNL